MFLSYLNLDLSLCDGLGYLHICLVVLDAIAPPLIITYLIIFNLDCVWQGTTYCEGDVVIDLYRWWFESKVGHTNRQTIYIYIYINIDGGLNPR